MDDTSDVQVHIALPRWMVEEIDRIASDRGTGRAHVIGDAVADFVGQARAARLAAQLRDYVETLAEHSAEFAAEADEREAHRLIDETEW